MRKHKQFRIRFTKTLIRNLSVGIVSIIGAFAMGLQTAGEVQPFDHTMAAIEQSTLKGDVNNNGELDAEDVIATLTIIEQGPVRTTTDRRERADVDGDNFVTAKDALWIAERVSR